MNQEQFLQQLMRLEDGTIEPEDLAQLEAAMRQDPQWRALFTQTHLQTMALHEALRSESFVGTATPEVLSMPKRVLAWVRRPVAAMSMGLLLGLLGASWVWSAASPHGTSQRMASLIASALVRQKRRYATKPTRGSQRRRVDEKRHRGDIKRGRQGGSGNGD